MYLIAAFSFTPRFNWVFQMVKCVAVASYCKKMFLIRTILILFYIQNIVSWFIYVLAYLFMARDCIMYYLQVMWGTLNHQHENSLRIAFLDLVIKKLLNTVFDFEEK